MRKGFSIQPQQLYQNYPYCLNKTQPATPEQQKQQNRKKQPRIKFKIIVPSPKKVNASGGYFQPKEESNGYRTVRLDQINEPFIRENMNRNGKGLKKKQIDRSQMEIQDILMVKR